MNRAFLFLREKFLQLATASAAKTLPVLGILAFLLNAALEAFGRRSLGEACIYLAENPLQALLNTLIILFTLSLCLLVRRRMTLLTLLSVAWLGLGVTNFIVLSYRSSPLSAIDFLIIKAALGVVHVYFTLLQLILIAIIAAAFIVTLVLLFLKCPKCRVSYHKSISCVAVIGLAVWGLFTFTTSTSAAEYESGELSEAYEDYGFAYCFTRSIVSQGVECPDDYSEALVSDIIHTLEDESDTADVPAAMSNVIIVQLESFCDVSCIEKLICSENPTPNFTALKETGISGMLTVPHVGGGTANVEFEVLTGMNLDHFGFGEYPYTTILREQRCESLASQLKSLGCGTHAIHNHTATFYDRHLVYPRLGFDTFTPIEMMGNIERNPLGWAKDSMLTDEILAALDSTDGPDFVFAVSVQGHGKYPSEALQTDGIEVYGAGELYNEYRYYVNQLREMDRFIGELTAALESRGEACTVVFYGDHMPAIDLTDSDVTSGDLYRTEYAVWSNTPLSGQDRDLHTYQLAAYIQQLLGLGVGEITLLHQSVLESDGEDDMLYDDTLQMLEYAALYETPQAEAAPSIRIGTRPITVSEVLLGENTLYVIGDGFNEYSRVRIDGFLRDTQLLDETTLAVENIYFGVDSVEVLQIAEDGTELAFAEMTE